MVIEKEPSLPPEEEEYVSDEDEDFDPNAAEADENVSSSSESEIKQLASKAKPRAKGGKRKSRKAGNEEAEDVGFDNSGDEGIVERWKKRKRKGAVEEDSGGEGGFVQTRNMRAAA